MFSHVAHGTTPDVEVGDEADQTIASLICRHRKVACYHTKRSTAAEAAVQAG
jgi:hypothetical protein